jgi:hypothetical protein
MSKPLALTDEQMSAVINAAAPLLPCDRDAFLRALADALRNEPGELGDGAVHRAIRHLIRPFWRPRRVVTPGADAQCRAGAALVGARVSQSHINARSTVTPPRRREAVR